MVASWIDFERSGNTDRHKKGGFKDDPRVLTQRNRSIVLPFLR